MVGSRTYRRRKNMLAIVWKVVERRVVLEDHGSRWAMRGAERAEKSSMPDPEVVEVDWGRRPVRSEEGPPSRPIIAVCAYIHPREER